MARMKALNKFISDHPRASNVDIATHMKTVPFDNSGLKNKASSFKQKVISSTFSNDKSLHTGLTKKSFSMGRLNLNDTAKEISAAGAAMRKNNPKMGFKAFSSITDKKPLTKTPITSTVASTIRKNPVRGLKDYTSRKAQALL